MGLMGYFWVRENLHSGGKSGLFGRTGLRFPEKWRMFLGKYPINSGKDRHLLGKISHALRMKIGTNPPEDRHEFFFCRRKTGRKSPFLRCFIVFCENARQPKTRNWKFLIEKVCFGFHLSNRKRQSERTYLLFRNKLYLCTD